MEPIYLDYNATTPLDPDVMEAMRPYIEHHFGNPSSLHKYGIRARQAVDRARRQLAALLNAHADEIIFTSGGTESNNFAIKGVALANRHKGNHIITSSIEHPAVTEVCRYLENNGFIVTWLPVDQAGRVSADELEAAITPATILVTIMHANNETGVIQPVEEIGQIVRRHHILFHTDAAQSVGKIPVDVEQLGVDLLTVAGHKLYAPKGIGALYIRRGVQLEKLIHGADHEANLRAGTENVLEIVGLGEAAHLAKQFLEGEGPGRMCLLRDRLGEAILEAVPDARVNGEGAGRLPNTLSIGFPGIEAAVMLGEMKQVAASAGAACHAGEEHLSGVLAAMQVPEDYAMGTIRFSLGRTTTENEIDRAVREIVRAYGQLKGGDIPGGDIRLTAYTHALGCACKIRPQVLEELLLAVPAKQNPDILVGHETSDDAVVYRMDDGTAIVQTVDIIPPVVDDPYHFGAIAAANALSDIYAMGGEPLFALAIVAFPENRLPFEVLRQIQKGASDKAAEAGIQIVGGHSIEDNEPKFGLVVTGKIHPGKILRNSGARPGDAIILTKPLGTGIITTAIKRGVAGSEETEAVIGVMSELNHSAAAIMAGFPVNGCTDVTGFGLLGHLREMVTGAGVRAVLEPEAIPIPEAAWRFAAAGLIPGGTRNNLDFTENLVKWRDSTPPLLKFILADAQTSGGLLITLPAHASASLVDALHGAGIGYAAVIGRIETGGPAIDV